MVKWRIAQIGLLILALGAILFPAVVFAAGDGEPPDDPARITSYEATYNVATSGRIDVEETITTSMPWGRHGIFRFWDTHNPGNANARLIPQDITVLHNGSSVPVQYYNERNLRFRVAKIGDPTDTLTAGVHTYTIKYHVNGALFSGDRANTSVFAWYVVPRWEMPVAQSTITVNLPVAGNNARCTLNSADCTLLGSGSKTLTLTTGALQPRTPIVLRADLPMVTPPVDTLPWTARFDGILSRSTAVPLIALLLALSAAFLGWRAARYIRETEPGQPLLYEPPQGVGPAQAVYTLEEHTPKRAMTGTLLYQAEQGLTKLTALEDQKSWAIQGMATPDKWEQTDPATRALGIRLGITTPGATFIADGQKTSGEQLAKAKEVFDGALKDWSNRYDILSRDNKAVGLVVLEILALVMAIGMVFFAGALPTIWIAIPVAFAVMALPLLSFGATTRRTQTGRALWTHAGGFRRILSTPASESRFDFSANKNLFTAFIPWAVAFDCADKWEEKYRAQMHTDPPAPVWIYAPYGMGFHSYSDVSGAFSSFESSVNSAMSSYQASQSSSGGGGGGGGFGGGGGGGGSW